MSHKYIVAIIYLSNFYSSIFYTIIVKWFTNVNHVYYCYFIIKYMAIMS